MHITSVIKSPFQDPGNLWEESDSGDSKLREVLRKKLTMPEVVHDAQYRILFPRALRKGGPRALMNPIWNMDFMNSGRIWWS